MYTSLLAVGQSVLAPPNLMAPRGAASLADGFSFQPLLEDAGAEPSAASPVAKCAPQQDPLWLLIFCDILTSLLSPPVTGETAPQGPATADEQAVPEVTDTTGESVLPAWGVKGKARPDRSRETLSESLEVDPAQCAAPQSNETTPPVMLPSPAPVPAEQPMPLSETDSSPPAPPSVPEPATTLGKPDSAPISFSRTIGVQTIMMPAAQPVELGRHIFQLILQIPQAQSAGEEVPPSRSATASPIHDHSATPSANAAPKPVAPVPWLDPAPCALRMPEAIPPQTVGLTPADSTPDPSVPERSSRPVRLATDVPEVGPVGGAGVSAVPNPASTWAMPFAHAIRSESRPAPPPATEDAPATQHAPPATATRVPASESIEPVRKIAPAGNVQNIGVMVRNADQTVRLQIRQNDGSVRVSVHTDDPRLAEQLRTSLPQLVQNLDQQGYQPRVAVPQGASTDVRSGDEGNSDSAAYQQSRQQRQRNPRRAWQDLAFQLHE